MNIVEQKENKLLKRKEIIANLQHDEATPTRETVRKELAKKLKTKEELIIVKKLRSSFGGGKIEIFANVYEDRATLEKVSLKHLVTRNKGKEEAKEGDVEE